MEHKEFETSVASVLKTIENASFNLVALSMLRIFKLTADGGKFTKANRRAMMDVFIKGGLGEDTARKYINGASAVTVAAVDIVAEVANGEGTPLQKAKALVERLKAETKFGTVKSIMEAGKVSRRASAGTIPGSKASEPETVQAPATTPAAPAPSNAPTASTVVDAFEQLDGKGKREAIKELAKYLAQQKLGAKLAQAFMDEFTAAVAANTSKAA